MNKLSKLLRWSQCHGPYGCYNVAAQYIGLLCALPIKNGWKSGTWQHGWLPPEMNIDPDYIIAENGRASEHKSLRYRVWREDQARALAEFGFTNTRAIGSPWIYLGKSLRPGARLPGSLLVMPAHSLPDQDLQWSGEDYADYIAAISPRFTKITICIHPACLRAGNWASSFRKMNLDIIEGASANDPQSIPRMAAIFRRHDFVTGNEFGSFAVYSAYFGAKASIAGPTPKREKAIDLKQDFFANRPDLLERHQRILAKLPAYLPQLYVDPWNAAQNHEWAAWQLGEQHRLTPSDLMRELEWSYYSVPKEILKILIRTYTSKELRTSIKLLSRRLG